MQSVFVSCPAPLWQRCLLPVSPVSFASIPLSANCNRAIQLCTVRGAFIKCSLSYKQTIEITSYENNEHETDRTEHLSLLPLPCYLSLSLCRISRHLKVIAAIFRIDCLRDLSVNTTALRLHARLRRAERHIFWQTLLLLHLDVIVSEHHCKIAIFIRLTFLHWLRIHLCLQCRQNKDHSLSSSHLPSCFLTHPFYHSFPFQSKLSLFFLLFSFFIVFQEELRSILWLTLQQCVWVAGTLDFLQ